MSLKTADIRSFFVTKNPKGGQQKLELSTKKPMQKPGQKKRPIIIDSDSDEESNTKRNKPSTEEKKLESPKKLKVFETKSKYFDECPIKNLFSNAPVKRDNSRKIIKKIVTKENKESHFDKDFEAELANLDESWLEDTKNDTSKISKVEEDKFEKDYNLKGMKESPKKVDAEEARKNRKSPRKQNSNEDISESPKKKLKLEPTALNGYKKDSPVKNAVHSLSSPENSPKKSLSNKSPLKKGKSITPEKPPYKKLFLIREKKENGKNEVNSNVNLSNKNDSDILKTEEGRNTSLGKESPKKRVVETCSPKETSTGNGDKSKKPSIAEKVIVPNKKKDESVKNKQSDKAEKKVTQPTARAEEKPVATSLVPSNLWVERYKPTSTKQIIGQQGEKSCVNKLITWLNNWEKNHSGAKKLAKPSPWAKNDDGAFFKAALLSGPPGVGKTTTAHLVCKELGFDIVEFNASDTRSKKLLHEEVSELLSTKSLSPFFTGKGDQVTKRHVLLMDEVDGMAGNEDRGGVQELISLIKQARVPVVCMCNDRNHPKIRSLANYCFDLRFSKPRVEQIRGAMMSVCFKEKLKLKPDELADIITSANQDIRLVMNHLSMLALEKSSLANSTKHIKMGPWDIVRKIFSEQDHKTMSIHDKCDLFFHDYSVTPLFVQENYLNAVPHKPEAKNKIKKMELFAKAARSLSFGDLTEKRIRSNNAWGLLPVQAIFSSLVPGEVLEGHLGAQISFPAWFGKNSRQTKLSRLVQELTVHSRLKISGNREAMNLDYLTSLGSAITSPLLRDGADGVPAALSVLSEYCLVREDMESIAELSTWPGCKNRFAEVDSKVKAAFTRAYNKTSAPTPYAAVPIKKGRGDVDTVEGTGEEDEAESQDVDNEEEEGLEADAMIMVKKKPAGKKADKDSQPSTSKGSKTSKRGRKK